MVREARWGEEQTGKAGGEASERTSETLREGEEKGGIGSWASGRGRTGGNEGERTLQSALQSRRAPTRIRRSAAAGGNEGERTDGRMDGQTGGGGGAGGRNNFRAKQLQAIL